MHLSLASQIPLSVFRFERDYELTMACHASRDAGATLDQAKPVNLDLDTHEGRKVEYEFLCLGWLDEGRLEDAVFLRAAEGAA